MRIHQLDAIQRAEACRRAARILMEYPADGVLLLGATVSTIRATFCNLGMAGRFKRTAFHGGVLVTRVTP